MRMGGLLISNRRRRRGRKAVVGSEGGSWFGVMAMGTLPVHGIEIKLVSHRRHHIIAPVFEM